MGEMRFSNVQLYSLYDRKFIVYCIIAFPVFCGGDGLGMWKAPTQLW